MHAWRYRLNVFALANMIVIPVSRSELAMNSADVTALKAHVAINVRNVEASIEFYRKLFGIEPCRVRKGYAKFDVSNPALNFTLNQVPFTGAGTLSHLGIQVASTEDVLAIRRTWTDAGMITRDDIKTDGCSPLHAK